MPRIAVEAATPFGWGRYLDSEDHVVGVHTFGLSAGYKDLYEHFGLTVENITQKAIDVIAGRSVNRPEPRQKM